MKEFHLSWKTTSCVSGLNAVMIPPKVYAQKPNSLSGKLVLFDRCDVNKTDRPNTTPTVRAIRTFAVYFSVFRLFVASLLFMKGISYWFPLLSMCCHALLSWHLYNLPCVSVLYWLISIARFVFKSECSLMYQSNRSFNIPLGATPRAFEFLENFCSNSPLAGPKSSSNAPTPGKITRLLF